MWKPGDVIVWRGIFNQHLWHVQTALVVKDGPRELVAALLPGAESVAEKTYSMGLGKQNGKRRWDYKESDWELVRYAWHTNRVLVITEPDKFYSVMLFWNQERNEFLGYYVNFQLPFQKSHCGIDSLDLDLDIDIEPDLSFRWKDEDDYRTAIAHGVITPEWVQAIESAKPEILELLERRRYPFDGSWLDWMPDPDWTPPKLPEGWDLV